MTAQQWGTSLIESEYDALERCGIHRERASQLPWRHVDSLTGAEMFGRNGSSGQYDGLLIPNYWPEKNTPRSYRLRRAHPDLEQGADGKVKARNRYLSAPGERNVLYFAYGTRLEWLEDTSLAIIITEGEKKCESLWNMALRGLGDCADKPRWLPVGLLGVWSWRGKVAKQDGPHGEREDIKGVIPDFDQIAWTGRRVTILFDANVHDDGKAGGVSHARNALAKELRQRGAHVMFVDIPFGLGQNGIDDVAGQLGVDTAMNIINAAYDPKTKQSAGVSQPSKIVISELPDVRTYAPEKIEFLVPGVIVKSSITLITGPPASGKTTVTLWMGDAVAYGREILGGTCEQHPVLYMSRELPAALAADLARRFQIDNGPGTNLFIWGRGVISDLLNLLRRVFLDGSASAMSHR